LRRLQLGRELIRLREAAGVTREQAAARIECGVSKLGRIERGQMTISVVEVQALLELYGVSPADSQQVLAVAREARKRARTRVPDWARAVFGLEAEAVKIKVFRIDLIPGLLQTPEYTRAIARAAAPTGDPEDVNRIVASRGERQARLTSDIPPQLWVVMHEAAIRTQVGGPAVMRQQLARVLELGQLPNVSIQVLPFSAGAHGAMGTSFMILHLPDENSQVVYLEDLWSADYLSRSAQIRNYTEVFDRLCTTALSVEDTATMIQEVVGTG
jgi:transcriptional regulator with XRE-family HTH domain